MKYRRLGKTNLEVSILGFGCMRFPIRRGSGGTTEIMEPHAEIDEEKSAAMIHQAIEHGINYFDTAYLYHNGKSEPFLGKTLGTRRGRVIVATKLPTWLVQSPDDFQRLLDEQLQRLETQYIDIYLLHGLDRGAWDRMKEMGVLSFLDRIQADRLSRFVGFSFHDDVRTFKEIMDAYDWAVCQIQYNYFDEHFQAGKEGLEYAASKGIGVVVMEPLRGGKLARRVQGQIQAIWDSARQRRSPAAWALQWVWNHAQVATALSGMSSMEQLQENIAVAGAAEANTLTADELAIIGQVAEAYRKKLKVDCTTCGYCLPCPNGVKIPTNFCLYNDAFVFDSGELAVKLYNDMLSPEQRASNCSECGECEDRCPQKIQIMEELKKVHARLCGEKCVAQTP